MRPRFRCAPVSVQRPRRSSAARVREKTQQPRCSNVRFLDKYAGREKRLRALEREVNRLRHAQGNAPIIPLERPFQRGWVKFYVLEDRVSQRPDAAVFRAMLAEINRRVYARERSFIARDGHEVLLRPKIIPTREWLKLAWPMSHQRFFGYGHWRLDDQPWTPI